MWNELFKYPLLILLMYIRSVVMYHVLLFIPIFTVTFTMLT